MSTTTETHAFEAEVQEVLSLVIHSLYTNREIFLRELISNASDALDKLRFESLTDASLLPEGEQLGIAIDVDAEQRLLRIADNGIGMSREELVQNLGRIASSGTRRFLAQIAESQDRGGAAPDLIGQFGVGFYASFMVADEVVVETRRAGSDEGWRWTSKGDGQYSLEPAEGLARGTLISLHLREDKDGEEGGSERQPLDGLLTEWRLREIVTRYSDFVEYPVQMEVERSEPVLDDEGKPVEGEEPKKVLKTETLNSMKPLWARPKAEIEETEYEEFYKHLTHDWSGPAETIHFKVEGSLDFTALVYLPKERSLDLFDPSQNKSQISLYVRRVLIQKECEELLPVWLRFVRGVVECSDLPLNVSRETLQDDPRLGQIKKRLVKKVLDALGSKLDKEREAFEAFWKSFGGVFKEGIYFGENEDDRLAKLCLFESTRGESLTTLDEYLERASDEQEAIYCLLAASRQAAESSPHLEAFRDKGYEVLFLTDPVDEWMLQRFSEYAGKPLRSIEKGEVELGGEEQKKALEERSKEHQELLTQLGAALEEHLSEVRLSSRLKDSPAVLVNAENAMSPQLARMLASSGRDVPKDKRILELNPDHALFAGLSKLFGVDAKSPRIAEYAELLHGQALIAEGSPLPDPAHFAKLLTELMVGGVKG